MIRNMRLWLIAGLMCLAPVLAGAQSDIPSGEVETLNEVAAPVAAVPVDPYADWRAVAAQAEADLQLGSASLFRLERRRADVAEWRDQFLESQSQNASRIATVESQIAALGEATDTEAASVTARREALTVQLQDLMAPVILAQEAYAQANGLVAELDVQLRARQTSVLTERSASPLEPTNWTAAFTAVWAGIVASAVETNTRLGTAFASRDYIWNWLVSAAIILVGITLNVRHRRWINGLSKILEHSWPNGRPVWEFVLSSGFFVLPYMGVWLIAQGIIATEVVGFAGQRIIQALPIAAAYVLAARWLSGRIFPQGDNDGPLGYGAAVRSKARHLVSGVSWTVAIGHIMLAVAAIGDGSSNVANVVVLPVEVFVGVYLFRAGLLLTRNPSTHSETNPYRQRIIVFLGRLAMIVAVLGPILAAIGYTAAAEALLYPAVTTFAILACLILVQQFAVNIYILITGRIDGAADALVPVLIAIVLVLSSLPVLAIVWGARQSDILEIWARFREGLSIGDSRISPTDFLVFVLVFGIGYALTKFIQGMLRSAILPRTQLDVGARNAIVAGVGYVGVFLAALAAITSAGLDLSNLAIVAGALSVGIGFGLQNIVSNFVSGIILLIERPISEGDWIEVGGQMGYVRDISVRSTRIETFDRTDVIVPNADLVSGQVTNWTRGNSVGRLILPIGVAYGTDTRMVTKLLDEIVNAHPMVLLNPAPKVLFVNFGADSLDFEVRAILRDVNFKLEVQSDLNHAIAKRFTEAGIEIPFAQRDLWLRNPETLKDVLDPK